MVRARCALRTDKLPVPVQVTVLVSTNCSSAGEALRLIDQKHLIKNDFVLVRVSRRRAPTWPPDCQLPPHQPCHHVPLRPSFAVRGGGPLGSAWCCSCPAAVQLNRQHSTTA